MEEANNSAPRAASASKPPVAPAAKAPPTAPTPPATGDAGAKGRGSRLQAKHVMTAVPVLTRINIVLKNSESAEDLKKMRGFDPLGIVTRERAERTAAGRSTPSFHDVKTTVDPRTKRQIWTVETDRLEPVVRKRRYDLTVGAAVAAPVAQRPGGEAGRPSERPRVSPPVYSTAAVGRLVEENGSLRQELADTHAAVSKLQDENEGLREAVRLYRGKVQALEPPPADSDPPHLPLAAMRALAADLRRVEGALRSGAAALPEAAAAALSPLLADLSARLAAIAPSPPPPAPPAAEPQTAPPAAAEPAAGPAEASPMEVDKPPEPREER